MGAGTKAQDTASPRAPSCTEPCCLHRAPAGKATSVATASQNLPCSQQKKDRTDPGGPYTLHGTALPKLGFVQQRLIDSGLFKAQQDGDTWLPTTAPAGRAWAGVRAPQPHGTPGKVGMFPKGCCQLGAEPSLTQLVTTQSHSALPE